MEPSRAPKIGFEPSVVLHILELIGEYVLHKNPEEGKTALEAGLELASFLRRDEVGLPRLEMRKVEGEVVHFALDLQSLEAQEEFMVFWRREAQALALKTSFIKGGRGTVEIGGRGVSKATVIRYLQRSENFLHLLDASGYQSALFDARKSLCCLVADADGTLLPYPLEAPVDSHSSLAQSAAREPLLSFLEHGGFLVINTGNDPKRIAFKILKGIPEERRGVLSQIALAACGGHLLYLFANPLGELKEVLSYRYGRYLLPDDVSPAVRLFYLGDDPRKEGNDWPAFEAAGFASSLCVPSLEESRDVPPELQDHTLPGNEKAVASVLELFNRQMEESPQELSLTPLKTEPLQV
ncbi:MAG: hypothetical protein A3G30_02235 [Chlamydiae bacterium RIFCSPLOWO2_12_FULL_49_12]|nr:MAG: hypothetical protein A3E26_01635 [Chlamydiae bacterium RIFCSPHIGHO2_12_FULL_49_32]OGN70175.1 MAG: hypothetical protein A3I15_01555 [Chlamydiae bacterium RIFCSPLOWO2_02_FULL_49_12]OGN74877.1 MAG: hypothetical protein A3G30_02235 [Chlamydiae bacterium RIFCSPLOWO2_12_FULL_49_12]HCJ84236.1 hypothetical protein [Parachlamydiales bacterium]